MSLKSFIAQVLIVGNKTNVNLNARLNPLISGLYIDHEQCCL